MPSISARVEVIEKAPLESAVAVPIAVAPSYRVTVLLTAALPVTLGRATLVIPSPTTLPSLAGIKLRPVGAAGPVLIRVTDRSEGMERLLAASVAVTTRLSMPPFNAVVAVTEKLLLPLVVAESMMPLPS